MGMRIPSTPTVIIVSGDTVTFKTEEGADTDLYFSPETASVLSPKPTNQVSLTFGQALSYTFTAPLPGVYGVILQDPKYPAPYEFDLGEPCNPPLLLIQAALPMASSGPENRPET